MKSNASWTLISFSALSAMTVAAFAFGGCTVTSGTINDDGGVVRDSGGGGDGGGNGDGAASSCEGNKQTAKPLVSEACQSCLETACCSELKGCFNATPGDVDDAGTKGVNCDEYAKCIGDCGEDGACVEACDSATSKNIFDAYNAMLTCGVDKGCKDICGIATE